MSGYKLPSQTLLKLQRLKCSECSYITAYPNALQVHRLKVHAKDDKPDKPYKCGICSYQTSFRSNLQKHQRVHTGEKPYICACCCMRFSFRSNHKRHEQRCLAVRGLPPFQDPACGLTSPRYTAQRSYSLPSTDTSTSVLSKPENCGMDSKQGQFNLALNQFEMPNDESQRAIMDFYYKAFRDQATMMVAPAGLSLPHLATNPMAGYPLESEFKVKVKQEPVDGGPSLESTTRSNIEAASIKGRTSCPRKQSHPRKSQSEWVHSSEASFQEDIKPNLAELNQEAAMDCRTEQVSRHCERDDTNNSNLEDLKHSSKIRIFNGITRSEQCSRSRSCSPRNHSVRKIKKETRASSPVLLNDVQRDRSPVRHTGCSTSTSATPSSVAETETNCSLPFTLDAVLGDLSLGNLIDMLVQNGRIYRCHHCKILFEEYATYILHMGCHGSTNPFSCHFCGVGFHEKFGFLTHFMKCVGK